MKNLKTEQEIRDFLDTKTYKELLYLQACYGGPHNYLKRQKQGVTESFCRILDEQAPLRAFEDLVLSAGPSE